MIANPFFETILSVLKSPWMRYRVIWPQWMSGWINSILPFFSTFKVMNMAPLLSKTTPFPSCLVLTQEAYLGPHFPTLLIDPSLHRSGPSATSAFTPLPMSSALCIYLIDRRAWPVRDVSFGNVNTFVNGFICNENWYVDPTISKL